MNTNTNTKAPAVNLLHPELWLLLADPNIEPSAADDVANSLNELAVQNLFAAWREKHRRVRCIASDQLQAELEAALAEGCPAVHVHASLGMEELGDAVDDMNLPPFSERLFNLHGWGRPLADWWPEVARELKEPDAWVQVGWRLSRGSQFPSLSMPGDSASATQYEAAFKAWRAERFKLGDSGLIAGASDDDEFPLFANDSEPAESAESHQGVADDKADTATQVPTWQRPLSGLAAAGKDRLGVGAMGAMRADSASSLGARPWFTIVTLKGEAHAADGKGRWPYTVFIERQSASETAPWLVVQARVIWAEHVAPQARRHAHRLCLLPRLQAPVVLTLPAQHAQVAIRTDKVDTARIKRWPVDLPGTPVTLVPLPLA